MSGSASRGGGIISKRTGGPGGPCLWTGGQGGPRYARTLLVTYANQQASQPTLARSLAVVSEERVQTLLKFLLRKMMLTSSEG